MCTFDPICLLINLLVNGGIEIITLFRKKSSWNCPFCRILKDPMNNQKGSSNLTQNHFVSIKNFFVFSHVTFPWTFWKSYKAPLSWNSTFFFKLMNHLYLRVPYRNRIKQRTFYVNVQISLHSVFNLRLVSDLIKLFFFNLIYLFYFTLIKILYFTLLYFTLLYFTLPYLFHSPVLFLAKPVYLQS